MPSSGDLPNPGIKPRSTMLPVDSLPSKPPWKPHNMSRIRATSRKSNRESYRAGDHTAKCFVFQVKDIDKPWGAPESF